MGLKGLARRGFLRLRTELALWIHEAEASVAERTLPRFANQPQNLKIDLPRRIINPESISIGDDVWLGPGSFITAVKQYPPDCFRHADTHYDARSYAAQIHIGHRVTSSGSLVVGAAQHVEIGDDVLLAMNVTILDNLHGYQTPDVPYKYQLLQRIAPVQVGRGCWIGQNVVILPSVKIGEMSIVGANSVVTQDIPARCIAAGAPARILKQWDEKSRSWRPYDPRRSVRAHG
jgi:acetyltransferase-like isoleucine patch superfamily enzyme